MLLNKKMNDPDCNNLLEILREWSIRSDSVSDAEAVMNVVTWLEDHQDAIFTQINEQLPKDLFETVLNVCDQYAIEIENSRTAEEVLNIKDTLCRKDQSVKS